MTAKEIYDIMNCLNKVYDIVRIVDPYLMEIIVVNANGSIFTDKLRCHEVWNKSERCENCISIKACRSKSRQEKFEFIGDDVYHVTVKPVDVAGKTYALEIVSRVEDNVLVNAYGKNQFTAMVNKINHQLYTDTLTGLHNRRYYEDHLFNLKSEQAAALIDVDDFRFINNVYGHTVGDIILRRVGQTIRSECSEHDSVVRFGDDDFLLVCREISQDGFVAKTEHIKDKIAALKIDERQQIALSASIGCMYRSEGQGDEPQIFALRDSKNEQIVQNLLRYMMDPADSEVWTPIISQPSGNIVRDGYSFDNVARSFIGDYHSIIMLNMDTGALETFQNEGVEAAWIKQTSRLSYDEYRRQFAQKFLYPEDRKWFIDATGTDVLRERLSSQNCYIINHRIVQNDTPVYYQTKFVIDPASPLGNIVFFGGHSIPNAAHQDMKSLQESAAAHKNAVIASLSLDFDYICIINGDTGDITPLRSEGIFADIASGFQQNMTAQEKSEYFFKNYVHPADVSFLQKAASYAEIRQALQERKTYEVLFRMMIDEQPLPCLVKCVSDADRPQDVIIGLMQTGNQITVQPQTTLPDINAAEQDIENIITDMNVMMQEKSQAISRINEKIIELLGDITEARDIDSSDHAHRVKYWTRVLAHQVMEDLPEYNLTDDQVDMIAAASILHDIGKIMVSDAILLKPEKLTESEFELMKSHTQMGCEIMRRVPQDYSDAYLKICMEICLSHHEKYDGSGYPMGLRGDDIPISAQIVSVVDCFDALVSHRTYKQAYTPEQAYDMIMSGQCGAFSNRLLKCFAKCRDCFTEGIDLHNDEMTDFEPKVAVGTLANTKILLADDNEASAEMISHLLVSEDAQVVTAKNGIDAINVFTYHSGDPFDAILMDVNMPQMNGIEAAKIIRNMDLPYADTIPIIALSVSDSEEQKKICMDAGMNGMLRKPFGLTAITRALLECMRNQSEMLRQKLISAKQKANVDPLTGVRNITAYTETISDLTENIKIQPGFRFAIVLCDINGLKYTNDNYGHDIGDIYIKNCCQIICQVFKHSPVFRIGGDEFVVVLRGGDYDIRLQLMDDLAGRISSAEKIPDISEGHSSFAFGMSEYNGIGDTVSAVIKRADVLMYDRKRYMKFGQWKSEL